MTRHRSLASLLVVALFGCTEILGIEERTYVEGGGGGGTGQDGGRAGDGGGESCLLICGSECINPFLSDEHCGSCDNACVAGSACINGICDRRLRSNPSSYTQCARTVDDLICWGINSYGQKGDGTAADGDFLPTTAVTALPSGANALFATSAGRSTCAVIADGRLYCFGQNLDGSLGIGPSDGGPDDGEALACCHYMEAVAPEPPAGLEVVDVAGGGWWERPDFYCALAANQDVYCWGNGAEIPVKKFEHAVAIEAGISSACALLVSGEVWCWTTDQANIVGAATPFHVQGLPSIRTIGSAHEVSYAIDSEGEIWAWGPSANGQLGPGTSIDGLVYFPPRQFGHTFDAPVVQITGTALSSCALLASGDVYCWGKNGWQGDGTSDDGGFDSQPRKVLTDSILEIAASNWDMAARHENGQILRWGNGRLTPAPLDLP